MLFDRINLPTGGLGAARLIRNGVTGSVLVGERHRPPDISPILADGHLHEGPEVLVLSHYHLIPANRDLISLTGCRQPLRWAVLVGANAGQVDLVEHNYLIQVAGDLHCAGRYPAMVTQFVKTHAQPAVQVPALAYFAPVAQVQVSGMQISLVGAVAAMRRSHADHYLGKVKGR